jgi:nucleotide-binding universal stress UspA family protein
MTAVAVTPSRCLACPKAGGRVVVGIDDSPAGLAALRWAIEFAREHGAQLVAVRAWELGLPRHGGLRRHRSRIPVVITFRGTGPCHAAWNLAEGVFRAVDGHVPDDIDVRIEISEGNPGLVLTQIASRSDDVLVVGTRHGPSLRRAVHGSVSSQVADHAHCPVVVVPSES